MSSLSVSTLTLTLASLDQLLTTKDSEAFPAAGVDAVAHEYLFEEADKGQNGQPLELVILLPKKEIHDQTQQQIRLVLKRFFEYQEGHSRKELWQLLRQGRLNLLGATAFVFLSLLVATVVRNLDFDPFWHDAVLSGLTIASWVAFWQPIEILLYDWQPLRHNAQVYRRLAQMEVRVEER